MLSLIMSCLAILKKHPHRPTYITSIVFGAFYFPSIACSTHTLSFNIQPHRTTETI